MEVQRSRFLRLAGILSRNVSRYSTSKICIRLLKWRFPSHPNNFLRFLYILALGLSSSISFTFERSQSPKAAQRRQRLKQGSRSLLGYFGRYTPRHHKFGFREFCFLSSRFVFFAASCLRVRLTLSEIDARRKIFHAGEGAGLAGFPHRHSPMRQRHVLHLGLEIF